MNWDKAQKIQLLQKTEAESFATQVNQLKDYWLPQGSDPDHPYFHTLGSPIYIYGNHPAKYTADAKERNPVLLRAFELLYDLIVETLKKHLKSPVRLTSKAAVPGFHIYGRTMPNGGSVHFDLQQLSFARCFPGDWKSDFVSFALPLKLPESGGGLHLWPLLYGKDVQEPGPFGGPRVKSFGEPQILSYEVGTLYLINSLQLHQIAPNSNMKIGDQRITLQGHVIFDQHGQGVAYW